MRRLALAVLCAVACGAASAHGQTLALAYHQGDVYKYSLHSTEDEKIGYTANTDSYKFDLTADETVTVQSVDAGGTADLTILLDNLTVTASYQGVPNTSTPAR